MDIRVNVVVDFAAPFYELFGRMANVFQCKGVVENQGQKEARAKAPVKPLTESTEPAAAKPSEAKAGATNSPELPAPGLKPVDIAVVRERVSKLVRSGRKEQVIGILTQYGVTGFSQLQGDELASFYEKVKQL